MRKLTRAQAIAIKEAWDARDPLKLYRPTITQQAFHASPATHRLLKSVNRGGKSAAATAEIAYMLRGCHPFRQSYGPVTILQFVTTRMQASEVIGRKLFKECELLFPDRPELSKLPLIPEREIKHLGYQKIAGMEIPYHVEMKNGSRLLFAWSGVTDVWQRIAGLKLDFAAIDEDAGTPELWDELYPRLLDAQSDKSRPWGGGSIWSATNTEANSAYDAYEDRAVNKKSGHDIFVIGKDENPAIDPEKREALRGVLSEEAISIRIDGNMTAGMGGRIYPQFDMKRHVVPDYEPTPLDNIWLGWDPGIRDHYGLMFFCLNQDAPRTIRVIDFFHERGRTLDYQANQVGEWLRGRTLEGIIADPQAMKRDYSRGESVMSLFTEILFKQLKIKTERGVLYGRNIIQDGVEMMRRYLSPNPDDTSVEPLLLINERALYVAQQLSRARLKPRATRMAYNTIEGKDLEVFDLTRYIVSRQPYFHPRAPNVEKWSGLTATALPHIPQRSDPFAITPDMTPEQKMHIERLRDSSRAMESLFGATGPGGRSMGTGVLAW